jgi:S1-C subfamily serine protease
MTEPLLLASTRVSTFEGERSLTSASGFFFRRERRLFLVTSRHVVRDDESAHFPDRVEIELHLDSRDLTRSIGFRVPLYHEGRSVWRQATDSGGEVDVAVIELEEGKLPQPQVLRAFTPAHLPRRLASVEVGSPVLVVGFPLGFHDTLHHLPVVRQAMIASSFGVRFQGHGYFLTDARTHRGASGAPVVMRDRPAARITVDFAGRAFGPPGHGQPRPGAGRIARPQRGLVRRRAADVDGLISWRHCTGSAASFKAQTRRSAIPKWR